MTNILLVFGTRPEAIKMASLVKEFEQYSDFNTKVCVTGQHREMLDQVLDLFSIKPDFDLDVMAPGQDLFDITAKILLGLKDVFKTFNPDIVLVHGDTTTTLATTLASYYGGIKVGHVEAGLRTNNIYSPFPEEVNRQITSRIACFHFTPTEEAKNNLLKENIDPSNIVVTGNTVIDSLFLALNKIEKDLKLKQRIVDQIILDYPISKRKLILVTAHRRENFGEGFLSICQALVTLAFKNPGLDIVFPVHLNPNVQEPVNRLLSNINNIYLIKPLGYEIFIYLMNLAYFIITDSGGLQEEAPSLGKPLLLMRETTERPEAVESKAVKLVGTNPDTIIRSAQELLDNDFKYQEMSVANRIYGDGKACQKIIKFLKEKI